MKNTWPTTKSDFGSLAHRILIGEKRACVHEIARHLSMKENTLYGRLSGRSEFTVEEARKLLEAVPAPELANNILEFSPFFAAERVTQQASLRTTVERLAAHAVCEAADILRAIETALMDGKIDHRERPEILRQVDEAERSIASLKNLLCNSGPFRSQKD